MCYAQELNLKTRKKCYNIASALKARIVYFYRASVTKELLQKIASNNKSGHGCVMCLITHPSFSPYFTTLCAHRHIKHQSGWMNITISSKPRSKKCMVVDSIILNFEYCWLNGVYVCIKWSETERSHMISLIFHMFCYNIFNENCMCMKKRNSSRYFHKENKKM